MNMITSARRLGFLLVWSHYAHLLEVEAVFLKTRILTLVVSMVLLLDGCFLKQDRTTMVYGTITDQNQQPVDSILILIDGVQGFKYETLKQVYSDGKGSYELMVEVPKKYGSADVGVPFGLVDNPKYEKNYKGVNVKKNDRATNNCCSVSIGQKTKYDFQLIPR